MDRPTGWNLVVVFRVVVVVVARSMTLVWVMLVELLRRGGVGEIVGRQAV